MGSTVIPCLRYRDAPRMIEWSCSAFGFKRYLVVDDDQGGIAHAQLTLGPGMVMLGSARSGDDQFGRLQSTPEVRRERPRAPTSSCRTRTKYTGARKPQERRSSSRLRTRITVVVCSRAAIRKATFGSIGSYDPWKAPA